MGEAAALTTAMGWAVASIALTSAAARLPALAVAALQSMFASLLLAAAVALTGEWRDLAAASTATLLAVVASGMVGFALAEPSYVRALSILGVQRTYPAAMGFFILFSTAGGVALLGERFTPGLALGGILILGGAYLIAAFRREPTPHGLATDAPDAPARRLTGYALLVATPAFWTTATLLIAGVGDEVGPLGAAAVRAPAGGMLLTAFLLFARRDDLASAVRKRRDVVMIAGAAVAGIVIASMLFVYALFEAGAARTAILTSTSPLFAMALAIVFLGERATRWVLLGTTLTVTGIIIVVAL